MTGNSKTTVVIPVTDANQGGIEDLLKDARKLLMGSHKFIEAIIVETDNEGMAVLASALAKSSGQAQIDLPAQNIGNSKKTWSRKPKAQAPDPAEVVA